MATFRKGNSARNILNRRINIGTTSTTEPNAKVTWKMRHTAADAITLRGVPVVGEGIAGAMRHTNPATSLDDEGNPRIDQHS